MNRFAAVLLAASIAVAAAARQEPAQPPTYRAGTDIVEVDVVAHDAQGRIVADLRRDEFEVREEGGAQAIDVFYFVNAGAPVAEPLSAGADGAASEARAPRVFVAFFDDTHLTAAGFKRVQTAADTLFTKQFKPGDLGGVVHNGLMANSRLSADREAILKAVRGAKPNANANSHLFDERQWPRLSSVEAMRIMVNNDQAVLGPAITRACSDEPEQCRIADSAVRSKASQLASTIRAEAAQTMHGLIALLNGLVRMDGRKTILLLTEGFIAEETWPLVQDAVGLAARAHARIYTLDARGLDRSGTSEYLTGGHPGEGGQAALLKQFDVAGEAMNSLAVDTGGFIVRNMNKFDEAVGQIGADASSYFVIGYRPQRPADGQFRRITVSVKRPGVSVRARRGYVASARPVAIPTSTAPTAPDDAPTAEPVAAANGPVVTPAPAVTESESAATIVPPNPAASALRLRPDAAAHVTTLEKGDTPDEDAAAGWAAYQRGDVSAARSALGRAAAKAAVRPWVVYALGQSAYALRQYRDAAASWERVRTSTPEFRPVYFDLVDAYLQTREHDKALGVLRSAAGRWPADSEVFNALGVVQVSRHALDDAVQSFQKAVAIAPAEGVGFFNLAKTLEMRYRQSRHYVQQTRTWVTNETDRNNAVANYTRYLEIGGPFEQSAREALARLEWKPR
jgi:VWFA-related protein